MNEIRADMARLITEKSRMILFSDIDNIFDLITAASIKGDDSICVVIKQRDEKRIIDKLTDNGFGVSCQRFIKKQCGEDASILYINWRIKV